MSRFTTCGLTILLAFAPAALAVDGTVLINQSTITNGLTGCPTGGHFPIVICQPGSYRLSGNLTVPDAITDAIDTNVDDVTLDLNGFSILGPHVQGPGNGITSCNSNITVSNGTIRGLGGDGILLNASGIRIEGVKAVGNGFHGIVAGVSGDSIVTLCQASSNANIGIFGRGSLTNSSANGNSVDGVNWVGSVPGTVSQNNGGNGFNGSGTFTGNTAIGNSAFGIDSPGISSVIVSNALYSNGKNINAGSGSVVLNNVVQ